MPLKVPLRSGDLVPVLRLGSRAVVIYYLFITASSVYRGRAGGIVFFPFEAALSPVKTKFCSEVILELFEVTSPP